MQLAHARNCIICNDGDDYSPFYIGSVGMEGATALCNGEVDENGLISITQYGMMR